MRSVADKILAAQVCQQHVEHVRIVNAQSRAELIKIDTGALGILFMRFVDQRNRLGAEFLPEFRIRRDVLARK